MATIRKRQFIHVFLWEVQIRRKGIPTFTLSFSDEESAREWAKKNELLYIENPENFLNIMTLETRRKVKRKREFKNDDRRI